MSPKMWAALVAAHILCGAVDALMAADRTLGEGQWSFVDQIGQAYGVTTQDGLTMGQLAATPIFYVRLLSRLTIWDYACLGSEFGLVLRFVLGAVSSVIIIAALSQPVTGGLSRVIGFFRA